MDKKMRLKNFVEAMETIRKSKRMSLRALGRDSGLSAGYLGHLIHDRRSIPKPETIKKIATGLAVDPSYLYEAAGLNFSPESVPFIEEKKKGNGVVFSYQGQKIDDESMAVIKRILDTMPKKHS